MNYFQSVVLGLVQGLTEFLPVSSSGHLVLFTKLLKAPVSVSFDVFLHLSSLLAVIVYFWPRLMALLVSLFSVFKKKRSPAEKSDLNYIGCLIIGTIPAVIFGVLYKDKIEAAFSSILATAIGLLITALVLIVSDLVSFKIKKYQTLNAWKALWIGVAQAIAIFPGISRSGSTVSMALVNKLKRKEAAEFSFLLSLLAITGAFIFKLKDLQNIDASWLIITVGCLVSFLASYIAIKTFISLISKYSIKYFGYYCLALGSLILVFFR